MDRAFRAIQIPDNFKIKMRPVRGEWGWAVKQPFSDSRISALAVFENSERILTGPNGQQLSEAPRKC